MSEKHDRLNAKSSNSFVTLPPDPEVLEKPVRRKFTANYKQRVLEEADACREQGEIGALLRREGLYSSYLKNWRRERDEAIRNGLRAKKRGRKPMKNPLTDEVKRLERENLRLKRELEQAKLIIDIQKKTSQLLGITLTDVSEHEKILYGEGDD
jgi:transposase-like protein